MDKRVYESYKKFISLCNHFKKYDDVVSKRIYNIPYTLNEFITKMAKEKFNVNPTKDEKKEILLEALVLYDISFSDDIEYNRILEKIDSNQRLDTDDIFYIYDSLVEFKVFNIYSVVVIKFNNDVRHEVSDVYDTFQDLFD